MLNLAVAVASGTEFPPLVGSGEPASVLYWSAADHMNKLRPVVAGRFGAMEVEETGRAMINLHLVIPEFECGRGFEFDGQLDQEVETHKAELAVVESFGIHPVDCLFDLAERHRCAVMLVRPRTPGRLHNIGLPVQTYESARMDLIMDLNCLEEGARTLRFVKSHDNIHWPHNFMHLSIGKNFHCEAEKI